MLLELPDSCTSPGQGQGRPKAAYSLLPRIDPTLLQSKLLQRAPAKPEGAQTAQGRGRSEDGSTGPDPSGRQSALGRSSPALLQQQQQQQTQQQTQQGRASPAPDSPEPGAQQPDRDPITGKRLPKERQVPFAAGFAVGRVIEPGTKVSRSAPQAVWQEPKRGPAESGATAQPAPAVLPANGVRTSVNGGVRWGGELGEQADAAAAAPDAARKRIVARTGVFRSTSVRHAVVSSRGIGVFDGQGQPEAVFERYLEESLLLADPGDRPQSEGYLQRDDCGSSTISYRTQPDSEDDEAAQIAGAYLLLPTSEPPAVRATPQVFPLEQVASTLGREAQMAAMVEAMGPPPQTLLTVLGPARTVQQQQQQQQHGQQQWQQQQQQGQQQQQQGQAAAGSRAGSARPRSVMDVAALPLPLPPVADLVQLQVRSLTSSPMLGYHSRAELMLAATFGSVPTSPGAAGPAPSPSPSSKKPKAHKGGSSSGAGEHAGGEAAGEAASTSAATTPAAGAAPGAAAIADGAKASRKTTSAGTKRPAVSGPGGSAAAGAKGTPRGSMAAAAVAAKAAANGGDPLARMLAGRMSPVRQKMLEAAGARMASRGASPMPMKQARPASGGRPLSAASQAAAEGLAAAAALHKAWSGQRTTPHRTAPLSAWRGSDGWTSHAAQSSSDAGQAAARSSGIGVEAASQPRAMHEGLRGSVKGGTAAPDAAGQKAMLDTFRTTMSRGATADKAGGGRAAQQQRQEEEEQQEEHARQRRRLSPELPHPTLEELDEELATAAPNTDDLPATYAWGQVGRMLRRYLASPDPEIFNLSHALSGRSQLPLLAQVLPQLPALRVLLLANDDVDDWGLQVLVAALSQRGSDALRCLDLAWNRLGPEAPRHLLPLIFDPPTPVSGRQNPHARAMLRELVLAGNPIGDGGAELLFAVLGTGDCPISVLDVSRCGIGDRVSPALKGMLEGAKQLTVLRLGWNNLGVKGGKAVAEGIKSSSTLVQLHLPWAGITDTGAAHLAKALEGNASITLLDMSGNGVCSSTCVVLVETLLTNKTLTHLVLQDNPLGRSGARKLLRAVHAGFIAHVDIAGCGFLKETSNVEEFNPKEPNGSYVLDLAKPLDHQVAVELVRLAADQGAESWRDATLNGKPYSPVGVTKASVPNSGTLSLEFAMSKQPAVSDVPLTDLEFDSLWRSLVDPSYVAAAAAALEHGELAGGEIGSARHRTASVAGGPGAALESIDEAGPGGRHTSAAHEVPVGRRASNTDAAQGRHTSSAAAGSSSHGADNATTSGRHSRSSSAFHLSPRTREGLGGRHTSSSQDAAARNPTSSYSYLGDVAPYVPPLMRRAGPGTSTAPQAHAVTDEWKLALLAVLVGDCYFTSEQAAEIVESFNYGEDKVEAAVKVFGRVTDPENFSLVYECMNGWQAELLDKRIGILRLFSPANPTGSYSLMLAHQAQYMVANRLLKLYIQQEEEGLCLHPHHVCFTTATLDGVAIDTKEPRKITIPREGALKINFVDLRPIPKGTQPISRDQFAVLLSLLVRTAHLDAAQVNAIVNDSRLSEKVEFINRFESWTCSGNVMSGKVGALRRLSQNSAEVAVRDMARFVEVMRFFSITHYLTCGQLIELINLLPDSATTERLELCSAFWARVVDRRQYWSEVMRQLTPQQAVAVSHRLGYANVFDPARPAMHYKLRMFRADEYQIAYRLYRMALGADHDCFLDFTIDGVSKKISQSTGLWQVMRGSAADNESPTVTLEFDFCWEDTVKPHWAAVTIQTAWRKYLQRKAWLAAHPPAPKPATPAKKRRPPNKIPLDSAGLLAPRMQISRPFGITGGGAADDAYISQLDNPVTGRLVRGDAPSSSGHSRPGTSGPGVLPSRRDLTSGGFSRPGTSGNGAVALSVLPPRRDVPSGGPSRPGTSGGGVLGAAGVLLGRGSGRGASGGGGSGGRGATQPKERRSRTRSMSTS